MPQVAPMSPSEMGYLRLKKYTLELMWFIT